MQFFKNLFSPYRGLPKEIYIIFFARIINSLGGFVHPLLVLILTQKIGMDSAQAGLYVTLVSVISAPSMILGGKLADTLGKKFIIVVSQGLGGITVISIGLIEPSMTMAYLLMLSSLFFALCSPAYDALLADLTTPENRKGAYSLTYMGFNLGFAVGPIMAGLLYKNHLDLVFIIDGIATLLATTLIFIFIKETKTKHISVTEKTERKLEEHVEGSVFKVLRARPILIMFAFILLCIEFEYAQWAFTIPLHLEELFNDSGAAYYGTLAAFNGILVISFTPIITKLTNKIRPIKVIATGALCYAFAFGMLAFTTILPFFYVSIFIMTIGEIMIAINASTFIANQTPASHRGRVSSILPLIIGAGYATSPMIMGSFIAAYSITSAWMVIGSLGFISAGLMWLLQKKDLTNQPDTDHVKVGA
ncbi:MDR family MFS transporter [Bacillus sp. FJAT-27986]|uniref:MDR family MFS transporter n=1 Tax=Bacillus sp. FJAT-27986 TaxID=1743146 RepID=UPI00080AE27C|nr:MFS transporter [Bacillus sp. FJAT-27986]OCA89881.1 MFS transporter [Bacillus sp. FJAT-27986]